MNRKARLATVLVTGGVLAAGGAALAGPAIAGAGPFGHPAASATWSPGPGAGPGNGPGAMGNGPGAMGNGNGQALRDGSCLSSVPSGTLTDAQRATLTSVAQQEKLAGDLYQAFADKYPAVVFDRIAAAEDQHLAAVRTLLTRYGIGDPTAGTAAGQFTDATVQARYDSLLAQGMTGQDAAIEVGRQVETNQITSLQQALDGLSAADVTQLYQHLRSASQQHLNAFTTWAGR